MPTLLHSGAVHALLLAALCAAGAGADHDHVTTQRCKGGPRVRQFPVDSAARWLWLSDCGLTEINPADLAGLPNVDKITLYNNRIENIHPATFHNFPELNQINLDRNKLKYISFEMFAKHKLWWLSLDNNEITSLPRNFVSRLNRAGASLIRFSFFNNPWHCSCLIETLADVKRAGVTHYKTNIYNGDVHYDGARAECVFHGGVPCPRRSRAGMLPPAYGSE